MGTLKLKPSEETVFEIGDFTVICEDEGKYLIVTHKECADIEAWSTTTKDRIIAMSVHINKSGY